MNILVKEIIIIATKCVVFALEINVNFLRDIKVLIYV